MTIVFLGETLIDGTGRDPIEKAAIVVKDGVISQVGRQEDLPAISGEQKVIELGNLTIMPGLVDSHCHLFSVFPVPTSVKMGDPQPEDLIQLVMNGMQAARWWLGQGITTVRDMGMALNLDLGLRDLIAQGKTVGPRIFGSGRPICYPGWRLSSGMGHEINSPNEARLAARVQIRAGADQIKMFASAGIRGALGNIVGDPGWEQLTVEEMQAVAFEAHKAGLNVGIHAIGTQSIKNAILAGADAVEHGTFADEECIAMMKERGVFLVPTIASNEVFLESIPPTENDSYLMTFARRGVQEGNACVAMAREAGIRIATGTDFSQEGALARECACLNAAGLSPMEVIQAATKTGAEVLGMEERIGTLEAGKQADFIALDGNPLEDVKALGKIQWVVKEGQVFIHPEENEIKRPESFQK